MCCTTVRKCVLQWLCLSQFTDSHIHHAGFAESSCGHSEHCMLSCSAGVMQLPEDESYFYLKSESFLSFLFCSPRRTIQMSDVSMRRCRRLPFESLTLKAISTLLELEEVFQVPLTCLDRSVKVTKSLEAWTKHSCHPLICRIQRVLLVCRGTFRNTLSPFSNRPVQTPKPCQRRRYLIKCSNFKK